MNSLYEEEQRLREEQHDMTAKSEKRANDLHLEIEEVKAQLEQVSCSFHTSISLSCFVICSYTQSFVCPSQLQRSFRTSESEKVEAQDRVQELQTSTNSLSAAKRKAEQSLTTLQEEYEELESDASETGENLKKAAEQNSRMQAEMVTDKERMRGLEKSKVNDDKKED